MRAFPALNICDAGPIIARRVTGAFMLAANAAARRRSVRRQGERRVKRDRRPSCLRVLWDSRHASDAPQRKRSTMKHRRLVVLLMALLASGGTLPSSKPAPAAQQQRFNLISIVTDD